MFLLVVVADESSRMKQVEQLMNDYVWLYMAYYKCAPPQEPCQIIVKLILLQLLIISGEKWLTNVFTSAYFGHNKHGILLCKKVFVIFQKFRICQERTW